MTMRKACIIFCFALCSGMVFAEDGYRLWLRYDKIDDPGLLQLYRNQITGVFFAGNSPTLTVAKKEMLSGLEGLLGKKISAAKSENSASLRAGTFSSPLINSIIKNNVSNLGQEGFVISTQLVN